MQWRGSPFGATRETEGGASRHRRTCAAVIAGLGGGKVVAKSVPRCSSGAQRQAQEGRRLERHGLIPGQVSYRVSDDNYAMVS